MDVVLHALTDPHRRVMVEALCEREATAGELCALVPIAQPGASRHLAVLREAGLVDVRQEGRQRVYSLRPDALSEITDWLDRRRVIWERRFGALHTEVARGKRQRRETT
jgi:DNA-binding transcriptional ArsR family regulator